jgi:hypothetical protein
VADRRIGGAGGGSDKASGSSGKVVVALGLASGGALGGGASLGGAGSSAVDSVASQNLSTKKANGRESARKGDRDGALQRMGLRRLKETSKQDLECLVNSFGQVREFFLRTPCRSLDRLLFGFADDAGNVAVVSVAWVRMHSTAQSRKFQTVDDEYGTGNVTPLGGALLDMADIRFTGQHYASRRDGDTVVIVEAEPAAGQLPDDLLDAVAEVTALLPRPVSR